MILYNEHFYEYNKISQKNNGKQLITEIHDILSEMDIFPQSIVDVGCGTGYYLTLWRELGIVDLLGLDGSYAEATLLCPKEYFQPADLRLSFPVKRKFDLAVSWEVAEHLPSESAVSFVRNLCELSDIICFSAAIPYQCGTSHINEQFQSYWINIFGAHGYVPIDCIRGRLWNNPDISYWYKQNMMLFVSEAVIRNSPKLEEFRASHDLYIPKNIVHPDLFIKNQVTYIYLDIDLLHKKCSVNERSKIIFWGFGRLCKKLLCGAITSEHWLPDAIWDINAGKSDVSGLHHSLNISLPDFKRLNKDDVIIVTIDSQSIYEDIVSEVCTKGFANIVYFKDFIKQYVWE